MHRLLRLLRVLKRTCERMRMGFTLQSRRSCISQVQGNIIMPIAGLYQEHCKPNIQNIEFFAKLWIYPADVRDKLYYSAFPCAHELNTRGREYANDPTIHKHRTLHTPTTRGRMDWTRFPTDRRDISFATLVNDFLYSLSQQSTQ